MEKAWIFTLVFNGTELVSEHSSVLLIFSREWGRDEVLAVLLISSASPQHFKAKLCVRQCLLVHISYERFCPKEITVCSLLSAAQYPSVSQDWGWNTASHFQGIPGEIHTSGIDTRAATPFPKAWFCPKGAKRSKTPHMLLYSPLHLGKG